VIPKHIKISGRAGSASGGKNNELPDEPGVYFYYDKGGQLLYIGKATSLKKRVGSYFTKNIEQKDDKSFIYLAITNEAYPKPLLKRGLELQREGIDPFTFGHPDYRGGIMEERYLHIFGPYTSAKSLRTALDVLRKIIPWSLCEPNQKRSCFYAQIGKCPGVCTGAISSREYKKHMRELALFFSGKKSQLVTKLRREMETASASQAFERATKLRNRLFALQHIRDIALLTREETALNLARTDESYIDLEGRIEAYDISNISGTSAVGSMVVFEKGKSVKEKYRKFKIKTVKGANDVAMMEEVIRRRLVRWERSSQAWPLPEVMVIDGGFPQVHRVQEVLDELKVSIPIVGLAKGFDRKQDVLVYDKKNKELARVVSAGKELFQKARDEAHRFAVAYHRKVRSKKFINRD